VTFVLAIIGLLIVVVGTPIWMIVCLRELYGSKPRKSSTHALGSALQELDRLVARPAVVHTVEVQNQIVDGASDVGGD
jgi:hypothetical protein